MISLYIANLGIVLRFLVQTQLMCLKMTFKEITLGVLRGDFEGLGVYIVSGTIYDLFLYFLIVCPTYSVLLFLPGAGS